MLTGRAGARKEAGGARGGGDGAAYIDEMNNETYIRRMNSARAPCNSRACNRRVRNLLEFSPRRAPPPLRRAIFAKGYQVHVTNTEMKCIAQLAGLLDRVMMIPNH